MAEDGTVAWGGYAWGALTDSLEDPWEHPENFTIPEFKPRGSKGLVAAVSIIFTIWIVLANGLLLVILFKSRKLRTQWLTPFIVHMVLADVAVGAFYCPLSADFYIKQAWAYGCESLCLWNNFFFFSTFLSVHCLGLLDVYRLIGDCCHMRLNRKLKVAVTILLLLLLWLYMIFLYPALMNARLLSQHVIIHQDTICEPYTDALGGSIMSIMSFFAPAIVIVVLFIIILVREKCLPRASYSPEEASEKVFSFNVIAATHAINLGMRAPLFLTIISVLQAKCRTFACANSNFLAVTILEWILFAKSGIQPVVWLLDPDCKTVLLPMFEVFKRSEQSDRTELLERQEGE